MLNIPCVIFAGGKSSRMGEDKSLLPFSSFKTLTEYQLSRLSKIFQTVYISTKEKNKFNFDARFIEDVKTDNIFAPTAGFVAIFQQIKDDRFFALSVDSPFINEDIINTILEADSANVDATIAKTEFGTHPMCGIYHRSLKTEFEDMLKNDNHKLGFLLKNSNTQYINFEDEKPFLNLNHPHEYQKAIEIINTSSL
jgi:molybdopterin-guanine dinucleotide biosynthesis protein A